MKIYKFVKSFMIEDNESIESYLQSLSVNMKIIEFMFILTSIHCICNSLSFALISLMLEGGLLQLVDNSTRYIEGFTILFQFLYLLCLVGIFIYYFYVL